MAGAAAGTPVGAGAGAEAKAEVDGLMGVVAGTALVLDARVAAVGVAAAVAAGATDAADGEAAAAGPGEGLRGPEKETGRAPAARCGGRADSVEGLRGPPGAGAGTRVDAGRKCPTGRARPSWLGDRSGAPLGDRGAAPVAPEGDRATTADAERSCPIGTGREPDAGLRPAGRRAPACAPGAPGAVPGALGLAGADMGMGAWGRDGMVMLRVWPGDEAVRKIGGCPTATCPGPGRRGREERCGGCGDRWEG